MRSYLLALTMLSVAPFNPRAHASHVLPDACGADDVKFDVTTTKDQSPLVVPEGKALLVFIATVNLLAPAPVRYGVDGVWAGAAKSKSYFTYAVDPGIHHLCYDPHRGSQPGAMAIAVESGKVYFLEYRIDLNMTSAPVIGGAGGAAISSHPSYGFRPIEEDQGRFLVKSYSHATSKPNK